jgi:tetratricopeptide (TPR) repeat protein
MLTNRLQQLIAPLLVGVLTLLVYSVGIDNLLIFDDARLIDGTVFGNYGALTLKVRSLSYGSFVWLQALLGDGWWKQRIVNLSFHLGTAWMLYGLSQTLLESTQLPEDMQAAPGFLASRRAALLLGVIVFALNPVAVYAVAYLIQRSIVMAAFFVAAACLCFVKGLKQERKTWFALSLAAYLLAVASKEYAAPALALAVPLYVFVARPSRQRIAWVSGAAVVGLLLVALALGLKYGGLLGQLFEDYGRSYTRQLDALQPGAGALVYPLSIANEMALFFQYGFLWLFPNVSWMSLDLRPAFPTSLFGWPQSAGVLGYLGLMVGSAVLVLRRSDALGLLGLLLLMPLLLFVTEFSTVWIQDPFVLYRSYLWALPIPALVALPLMGLKSKWLYPVAALLAILLAGLSVERIDTMQSNKTVWSDAAAKIDLKAPANAFGRWRPYLNLGAEQVARGAVDEALRNIRVAVDLNEPLGPGHFNYGVALLQTNQPEPALKQFELARAQGYDTAGLYFQQGEAYFRLKKFDAAFDSYGESIKRPAESASALAATRQRHAKAAAAAGHHDLAVKEYLDLIQNDPSNNLYKIELGLTYIGQKNPALAIATVNPVIEQHPSGLAYYARAVAYFVQGNRDASQQDISKALKAEPNNPLFQGLQAALTPQTASRPAAPAASR